MAVSTPTRTNLTTGETGTRALGAGHLYLPPPLRDIPNRPCTMLVPRNTHSSQFGFGYPYFFQLSLPFSQGLERGHFRPLGSKHSGAWLYPPVYFKTPPPPHTLSSSLFRDPSHKLLLEQEIQSLLSMGVVEEVPIHLRGKGLYSSFFDS